MKGMKVKGISSTVHGRLPVMASWKSSITAIEISV